MKSLQNVKLTLDLLLNLWRILVFLTAIDNMLNNHQGSLRTLILYLNLRFNFLDLNHLSLENLLFPTMYMPPLNHLIPTGWSESTTQNAAVIVKLVTVLKVLQKNN
jgi:hypothetical protein